MICVEHISKLHDNFTSEGQSRRYVRRFFNTFLSPEDKQALGQKISVTPMNKLGIEGVIDLLYDVRCDVVHEGKYWSFYFLRPGLSELVNPNVKVYLNLDDFRNIVVKGCINAINDKLGP